MDYDDKDFQSQNLHLAGEGNTKFPPVLRPYALPKFDFDESLQGQLRFDNLVETEVFLGIESNEDNQWIDAFSRGSSGIGFSSTTAESCSIARHNNVWSEATSSESVEMLLKSVGQEDFIPRQSVIQESDACNELACLAKQMESNPKADYKNEYQDVAGLQPSDDIHEDGSGLKKDVKREEPQAGVSQAHENELAFDGSSRNLELSDICKNVNLPQSGIQFTDTKGKNENQQEVETKVDDSLNDKILDGSSASGELQNNISAASMQNIYTTSDLEDIQNVQNQVVGVSSEQQRCLTAQTDRHDAESYTFSKDANVDTQALDRNAAGTAAHNPDNSLCLSSQEEASNGGIVVKGLNPCSTNVDGSLGMVPSNVSDLQKAEGCSEGMVCKDTYLDSAGENAVKDELKDDQSALTAHNSPKVEIKGNISFQEVIEMNNSNCEISTNLQQSVDSDEKKTHDESTFTKEKESRNTDLEMDVEVSVSKTEAPILTVEGSNTSKTTEHDDRKVDGVSCLGTVSSTKSCILGESTQVCEGSEADKPDDKNFHLSIADQDFMGAPSDCSQINSDADKVHLVDKGVGSSSISPGDMETGLSTSSVSADVTAVDNSAAKALFRDVSLTSCATADVQPHCNVSAQKGTDQKDVQKKAVASNSVDDKEDTAAGVSKEAPVSTPIVSSEQGTIPCTVIRTDHQTCDTSRQLSCETVDSSTKIVETCAAGNIIEPQKTINHNQESSKEMDVSPSLHKLTAKQDELNPDLKISADALPSNLSFVTSAPSLSESHVELHEAISCPAYPTNNTCSPSTTVGRSSETEKDGKQNFPVSELINKDATNVLLIYDNLKGNDASKDKGSLTSEADLSKNNAAGSTTNGIGNSQPVPATTASKASTILEVSPPSGSDASKIKTAGDATHGSPQISDGEKARSVSKSTPQRRARRASNKTAGKETSRKASRTKEKETPPARQPERADKSNNAKLSSPSGFQLTQSNEMLQYGHIDSVCAKPFALLNASTSGLPDLNTSASTPVLFQQPFTDLQQIQLRAQIFVYGSLIQGTAPDEAYMISAFGGPDGGRSLWENAWRMCGERQHGQKSLLMNPETPVQSRSGSRASELAKQGSHQSKGISSPLGRSSSKATPTVVNPLIPLSSPLWNLPTPSDSLQLGALIRGSVLDYPRPPSSLHPYQTPPPRNILGHNTSWISQAPVRGPWIASPPPAPAPDTSSLFSASPISDSVKLNSVKGSSLPPPSGMKGVAPGLPSSSVAPQSIFVGTAPMHDASNVTVSPPQHSSDPKPKKRKKVMVSEDLGQKTLQTQSQLGLSPVVSSHVSTSVVLATSIVSVPKTAVEKSIVSLSSLSPADPLKIDHNIEKKFLSDESLTKVKEAGAHAEEAAALSAAAVNHSLEIWTQLDKQKNSGLVSVIEAELASSAVTVAAAAAVAKAAAAAAKVASNAALQAKLMAEEALASSSNEGTSQSNGISHSEGIKNLGKATPASILKGPNGSSSSSSIIVAAKEAARRRVEAASAAAKQAENMDAIVKAAELAAEAVSQVGKIVTMGDPLHISDLIEARPQGCWEAAHDPCQQVGSSKGKTRDLLNIDSVGDNATISHSPARNIPSDGVGMKIAASEKSPLHKVYNERSEDHSRPMDESEIEVSNGSEKLGENIIKEGSLVEVFKDVGEGCQGAWFTANVVSLKDGKAYVCYSVLVADGGAGPLKEWVPLEGEGDKHPRIRIARPLAGTSYEGTRKRRRAATKDYAWSAGDRVDVWIRESWQEATVKEKKKDEITVYFPARGETAIVRAWQVRSSLFWKDGKWIEYSCSGANVNSSNEGDTPREKRPKLGGPTVEAKGKDKMLKSIEDVEPENPNDLRLLNLSEKDKVFNIGKNSKNEIKTDTQRMPRTGLQKEGSRVIFGVPKPGKKRKFMEVSKHYVADRSDKVNDGNDSVKLANFLMPHGPAFRGWKNNTKNDTKEKRGATSKSKPVKSGKPGVAGKPIPPKDNTSANAFSLPNDLADHTQKINVSASHYKNASESENHMEMASYSANDGAAEGPILYPPLGTSSDAPSSNRTTASRASKGKLAPVGGKLGKIEEEKLTAENTEPRRSNRRIQPTSRLLEGLQSSLIVSKIPSVSHDKGHKNQNRNASRGNNQG
ncbi:hypothetical protein QN277_003511 [Acacia crassicarpa]|uniref:Agenet domain-containing protein n=1 Tax=Acacia crassicarpa TaxID=499986 RepID=A0AAE1IZN8_9FABA|nr:hypothetical protein QN277_003511 [Acacia crassicarpa]